MSNMNEPSPITESISSQPADAQPPPPSLQSLDVLSSAAAVAKLPSPVATPEPQQPAPVVESNPVSSEAQASVQPVADVIPSIETSATDAPPTAVNPFPPADASAPSVDVNAVSSAPAPASSAIQDTVMADSEPDPVAADKASQSVEDSAAAPGTGETLAPSAKPAVAEPAPTPTEGAAAPSVENKVDIQGEETSNPAPADRSAPETVDTNTDVLPDAPSLSIAASAAAPTNPVETTGSGAPQASNRVRLAEDTLEEPSAKRTKTEESGPGLASAPAAAPASAPEQAAAEFKKPELPASTQSLPPILTTTNGISAPVNTAVSAAPRFSTLPLTHVQKKILEDKIKNTKKTKHALPFLRPVDPIALGIPSYPTIITHPMDISTLEQNLKSDKYASLDAVVSDFELIINNCFKFNGENHDISRNARNLREYFMKQLETVPTGDNASKPVAAAPTPKTAAANVKTQPRRESRVSVSSGPTDAFPLREPGVPQIRRDSSAARPQRAVVTPSALRDFSYSIQPKKKSNQAGLKFCDHVMSELRRPKYAQFTSPFLYPVDPIALKIPQYNKIIKEPMDISTIAEKQQKGYYSTAEEFKADWMLMFANCFKFNPPGHPVHDCGTKLEHEFNELWKDKSKWVKAHGPQSQRESPASDDDDDEEDDDDDDENDAHESQLALLKSQLATMQSSMASLISGITDLESRRKSPKSAMDGKKKKKKRKSQSNGGKSAGGAGGSKGKGGNGGARAKAKPTKPRKLTRDQAKYITDMSERMTEEQVNKLTDLITRDYTPVGDEVEIDELPAEIQQRVYAWIKSVYGPAPGEEDEDEDGNDGERSRKASGAGTKKKRKPMKADEQMRKAAELQNKMDALQKGSMAAASGVPMSATTTGPIAGDQSSGGESDESSEEE